MNVLRRAALSACALAGVIAVLGNAPAIAQDAAPEVGWWTANQIAGVPIGQALLVPPGGSQVAAGADGPVSIAAVRFVAGAGGATYAVDLELGSDSEGVTVIACPITGNWAPVHGAPLSDAPAWDCTLAQAAGTIDAEAGRIAWDLPSDFVREGTVDVMLLPPDAAGSSTLTMSPPDEDSVTALPEPDPGASPGPDPTPSSPTATPTQPDRAAPRNAPISSPSFAPAPTPGPTRSPSPTAPVGLPSPLPTATPTEQGGAELAAVTAEDRSSTSGRVLGGLVLAALLGAIALAARLAPGASPAADAGRGVGRFVQPRTDPPLSI